MHTKNLIIGFGKAWKTLAAEFSARGEGVILIEKSPEMYGWTCINVGCIPSKILSTGSKSGKDWDEVMNFKNTLVNALRGKNLEKLESLSGVQIVTGTASFVDANTVSVKKMDQTTQNITADRIFINTGAIPKMPNIDGINLENVYNSTTIMDIKSLPKELIVVGAGFIGLEFADIFANFGTKVTILNSKKEFLETEDAIFAQKIAEYFEKKWVKIVNSARVQSLKNSQNFVQIFTESGEKFSAEAVLFAIGRTPNTSELQLEDAGVQKDSHGYIIVDETLKTSQNHIFAFGDVTGAPQFTYLSLDDFRIIKNQIFGDKNYTRSHRGDFATSVFLGLPFSHIGMKERDVDSQNLDIVIKKIPTAMIPKSKILKENDGMIQAIVNKKTGEILGCTLLCEESFEMINIVGLAVKNKLPFSAIRDHIFTHPTMAESLNDLFDIV